MPRAFDQRQNHAHNTTHLLKVGPFLDSCFRIFLFSVPRALDLRQRAGWVALLFLMKLYNKGKEYAKVQLHDN